MPRHRIAALRVFDGTVALRFADDHVDFYDLTRPFFGALARALDTTAWVALREALEREGDWVAVPDPDATAEWEPLKESACDG